MQHRATLQPFFFGNRSKVIQRSKNLRDDKDAEIEKTNGMPKKWWDWWDDWWDDVWWGVGTTHGEMWSDMVRCHVERHFGERFLGLGEDVVSEVSFAAGCAGCVVLFASGHWKDFLRFPLRQDWKQRILSRPCSLHGAQPKDVFKAKRLTHC